MTINTFVADYSNATHAQHIVMLLDHYSRDPMGNNVGLPEPIASSVVRELSKREWAFSVLVYVNNQPAGLVNAFEGFSTFACKPLVNIHDLVVHKTFRGLGLSHKLLEAVEAEAVRRGCVKLTLEVLSNNTPACSSYKKYGFEPYALEPNAGAAEFWQKAIKP